MGSKTANKQDRQRGKKRQERVIEIDSQKKGTNFGFCTNMKNKKAV